MYQVEASKALLKPRLWARRSSRLRVPRNVVMLGMVSLLTDISSEMVATVLPLYLVFTLGASPLVFGAIDGTYRGAAALVQVASGFSSDRWRRHKEVAGLGYGLSAIGKVALVAAGNTVGGIGAIVAVDRVGKGIRTAPRDALISLSSAKDNLATSFGVHRAMDSVGAMLGPLIAFGILLVAPARFDAVFVVSTLFALLGLAVLVLIVQGKPLRAPREGAAAVAAGGRRAAPRPALRPLLVAAAGLSVASVSDALIYVGLQRTIDFEPAVFPLLYVITAVIFMSLAIPVGQLADRVGKVPVLLAGHALLFIVYGVLLMTSVGYGRADPLPGRARRVLRRDRRGDDGARRGGAAGEAAGERDRDTDHRGQPRSPRLLGRLRRPLVRARPAERGADLRRRPVRRDGGGGAAAAAGAARPTHG